MIVEKQTVEFTYCGFKMEREQRGWYKWSKIIDVALDYMQRYSGWICIQSRKDKKENFYRWNHRMQLNWMCIAVHRVFVMCDPLIGFNSCLIYSFSLLLTYASSLKQHLFQWIFFFFCMISAFSNYCTKTKIGSYCYMIRNKSSVCVSQTSLSDRPELLGSDI